MLASGRDEWCRALHVNKKNSNCEHMCVSTGR